MDNDIVCILDQVRIILTSITTDFDNTVKHEISLMRKFNQVRNYGANVESKNYECLGITVKRTSNPSENEERFQYLYKTLFNIHHAGLDEKELCKEDANLLSIIQNEKLAPMWYSLTDEEAVSARLPSFNIARYGYKRTRMDVYNTTGKRMSTFESEKLMDRKIRVRDDLAVGKTIEVSLAKYLAMRIKNESDPHYIQHPIDMLLIFTLYLKAIYPQYYNVGLRYIELISLENDGTYPVVFKSNGEFQRLESNFYAVEKLRIIINSLINDLARINNWLNNDKTVIVSNYNLRKEIMLYYLRDTQSGGKKFKSAISGYRLYSGHLEAIKSAERSQINKEHLHPRYPYNRMKDKDYQQLYFKGQEDCQSCQRSPIGAIINSNIVRPALDKSKKALEELNLWSNSHLREFCEKRLRDYRPNVSLCSDLIYLSSQIFITGYARNNMISGFVKQLEKAYERNTEYEKKYIHVSAHDNIKLSNVTHSLKNSGYLLTKYLINKGYYPNGNEFRDSMSKWITSKSAGMGSFSMHIPIGDKEVKTTLTSKSAISAALGKTALDISYITTYDKSYATLPANEKENIIKQLNDGAITLPDFQRKYGIMDIGSRSTTGSRDIRAIYINKLTTHLLMGAIVGPHVEYANSRVSPSELNLFGTGSNLGNTIATRHMDGSLDHVSPDVEATTINSLLLVQSDCSNWDLHALMLIIREYYIGVYQAFMDEKFAYNETFMYDKDKGLNLVELAKWFIEYQEVNTYVIKYGFERAIAYVNFMGSGRLDTFYMNSRLNDAITKEISNDVDTQLPGTFKMSWVEIAGDDSSAILSIKNEAKWSDIEALRHIIVENYGAINHEINVDKTMVSDIMFEFSKISGYCGMLMRDPSIQAVESEKTSKADTLIDILRGQSQKMFEYTRRSNCDVRVLASAFRLLLSSAYVLVIPERKISSAVLTEHQTVQKYYPPFTSIITPTAYSGGLGFTLSGLSMNEILLCARVCRKLIEGGLHIVNSITFKEKDEVPNAVMRQILNSVDVPKAISKELKINDTQGRINGDIKYSTNDSALGEVNFVNGLKHRQNTRNIERRNISKRSHNELYHKYGIKIPLTMTYAYSVINDVHLAVKSMRLIKGTKELATNALLESIERVKISKTTVDLFSKYPLYSALNLKLLTGDPGNKQHSVRYAYAPPNIRRLEQIHGSRVGKNSTNSLRGTLSTLSRFLSKSGVNVTTSSIIGMIRDNFSHLKSGSEVHLVDDRIALILRSVTGRIDGLNNVIDEIKRNLEYWEDENIISSIVGTNFEHLNIQLNKEFPNVRIKISIDKRMAKLIAFMAFRHLCECQVAYNYKHNCVVIEDNSKTIEEIEKLSLFQNMRRYISTSRTPIHNDDGSVNFDMFPVYDDDLDHLYA